jgi:hypothetical protein
MRSSRMPNAKQLSLWMLYGLLAIGLLFAPTGNTCAAISGYDRVIAETLMDCPPARRLLGEGVKLKMYRPEVGCGQQLGGRASWTFQVAGDKARGTLDATLEQQGDLWKVVSGVLEVGGAKVDISECHR